jgi:hypothetical protein
MNEWMNENLVKNNVGSEFFKFIQFSPTKKLVNKERFTLCIIRSHAREMW